MSQIIPSAAPAEHPHLGRPGPDLAAFQARFPLLAAPPVRSLVIASEERSGSEYLCQLLGACGVLGRPSEYLNTYWMRRFVADWPEAPPAQMALAWRAGTSANGCFAIKLHWPQFRQLAHAMAGMSPRAEIGTGEGGWRAVLPGAVFVRLGRRDLLGQAISLYRARQGEQYHAHMPAQRVVEYDGAAIGARMAEIVAHRGAWQVFLATQGISALDIAYEDLARDPWPSVEAIAWAAGESTLRRSTIRQAATLAVQRDATTEAWRQRFLASAARSDTAGLGMATPPLP